MTATGPVGSAYVVIRAITTGLKDDIEKGFDKGVKDANIDKAGQTAGDKFGLGVASGIKSQNANISKEISKTISTSTKDVDRNVDHNAFRKLGTKLSEALRNGFSTDFENKAGQIGGSVARTLSKLVSGFTPPPIAWFTVLAIPAIGGAAKIITAYLAGIIAMLGFVITAALGAGAALAGAFVGLAVALGPVFLLLKTAGPLLEGFKAAVTDLAGPWKELGLDTQAVIFPALLDTLRLINDRFLPIFRPFIAEIANIVSWFIRLSGAVITTDDNLFNLLRVFEGARQVTEIFARIVARVFDALIPLFAELMPLAVQFAGALEQMVAQWNDFIRTSSKTGELSKTLQYWYDQSRLIFNALGDLAVGIWNVFRIGADVAQPFFTTLSNIAQKFRDFTESFAGASAIHDFFANSIPVVQKVNDIIGDIIEMIVKPLFTGNTSGIMEFLDLFQKSILPLLQTISQTITEELRGKVIKFTEALVKFIDKLIEAGALTSFLDTMTRVLDLLTKIMEIPGVEDFVVNMLGVVGSFSALNVVLGGFPAKVLGGIAFTLGQFATKAFVRGLQLFGAALLNAVAPGLLEAAGAADLATVSFSGLLVPLGLIAAAIAAVALIAVGFWAAFKFWEDIPGWVKPVVIVLGPLLGPIGLLAAGIFAVVAAVKNWREILSTLEEVGGAILEFFQNLPQHAEEALKFLEELPGKIIGFLENLPETLINLLSTAFEELPRAIAEAVTTALSGAIDLGIEISHWLMDQLGEILPEVAHFFGELPAKIPQWIISGIVGLVGVGTKIIGAIVRALIDAVPAVARWFADFASKIPGWIGDIGETGIKLAGSLVKGLENALPTIVAFFTSLPDKIIEFAGDAGTWLVDTGLNVMAGFLSGIADGATGLLQFFLGLPDQIWQSLDSGLQNILTDLGIWVGNFVNAFINFLTGLPGQLLGLVAGIVQFFIDLGGQIIGGVVSGLEGGLEAFLQFFRDLPGRIIDFAFGMFLAGVALAEGVLDGLRSLLDTAGDAIGGVIKGAINSVIHAINDIIRAINSFEVHIHLDIPLAPDIDFDFDGLNIPTIHPLAKGSFNATGLALVGEQGPELVDFGNVGSRVFPSDQLQTELAAAIAAAGGTGTVDNSVHFEGGVMLPIQRSEQDAVDALLHHIERQRFLASLT